MADKQVDTIEELIQAAKKKLGGLKFSDILADYQQMVGRYTPILEAELIEKMRAATANMVWKPLVADPVPDAVVEGEA